ncbi:MAG TPA: ABC transporter ATP-binding protein [Candidatus Acidoferrum sp.]|nr:ABC transporter ATP-binding protein [Candidatus Acidoferrum sp.]
MLVRLRDLVKRYGDTTAVAGVSLEIVRGSLTTILGPSGCGKTTLLRLIAGFVEPDEGDILIGGETQRGLPPYLRRTSTVFQEYALFPHMTVFDNVAYGLRLRRLPRAGVAEKVRHTLGLMRLEGLEDRLPRELSGGQQQRVALARSLIVEPEVLLMDEPLSNLDAKLRISVRSEIREIQQRVGITTLYVTHDQEEALAISDTVAVMRGGMVVQVGTPREIYERPADPFVATFVGQVNLLRATAEGEGLRLGTLTFPIPPDAPRVESGREVILALRPEAIRIGTGSDGRKTLTGRVVSSTYLGTTVRYRIDLAGQRLTVDDPDPADRPLLYGQVTLSFYPDRLRLWPATPEGLKQLEGNAES